MILVMPMLQKKETPVMNSVLTVGDLFVEDNYDWVNDEEASVFQRIEELIREFKKDRLLIYSSVRTCPCFSISNSNAV